jgi:hypothetical protein
MESKGASLCFFLEQGVAFTNSFGDIDASFYNSMVSMYEKDTGACAREEDYYRALADRLLEVVTDTEDIGWGFPDALLIYTMIWNIVKKRMIKHG